MDLAVPFNLFHPFINVEPGSPDPSATTAPASAPTAGSTAGSSASVKATRTRQDTRQKIFLIERHS